MTNRGEHREENISSSAAFSAVPSTIFLHCSGEEIANAIVQREYNRLLQLPRDRELEGDLLDRAVKAREWYEKHGRPFVAARRVPIVKVSEEIISVGAQFIVPGRDESRSYTRNITLHSLVVSQRLTAGEANALMILACSAGP